MAFAEETGITTGANRPGDITLDELALILAELRVSANGRLQKSLMMHY